MRVTKAQFASELRCSPSRITQLCEQGMPVLPGGRLDRGATLKWICSNVSGAGAGWGKGGVRGKADLRERALALLDAADLKPAPQAPPDEAQDDGIDYEDRFKVGWAAGNAHAACAMCVALRKTLPGLIAPLHLGRGSGVIAKASLIGALLSLTEAWSEDVFEPCGDSIRMPEPDWAPFGENADLARRAYGVFRCWYEGGPDQMYIEVPEDESPDAGGNSRKRKTVTKTAPRVSARQPKS